MARQSKKIEEFWAKVGKEPVVAKSEYRKMRAKMLWGCLVCGHEWEAEPREMIRAKASGCAKCATERSRKPNVVLAEYGDRGEFLKLDISSPAHPGAVMLVNKKKWEILTREGIGRVSVGVKGYPIANYKGKRCFVHRVLLGFPETVDHINGIKWDNRLCNLREATHVQQQMNRGLRKTNRSGVIGVYEKKSGVWEACLKVNHKTVHRSLHKTKEEAAAARAKAVKLHCGEYAPKEVVCFSLD